MHKIIYRGFVRATTLLCALAFVMTAVSAQQLILDENVIEDADVQKFQRELEVFSTIQHGINLTVVECELNDNCIAGVNRAELEQLISVIELRVNSLSLRYTETSDPGLESVLVAYADIRDGYQAILEKITAMPRFASNEVVADEFGMDDFFTAGGGSRNAISEELMQLFQDADEELTDDFAVDEQSPDQNTPSNQP